MSRLMVKVSNMPKHFTREGHTCAKTQAVLPWGAKDLPFVILSTAKCIMPISPRHFRSCILRSATSDRASHHLR